MKPNLSDKVGRSPYSSTLVTRSRGPQFWPNLETLEKFLMDLQVPYSGDFCVSESRIFFQSFLAEGFRSLGFVVFSFRLVFRSRIIDSS